MTSRKSIFLSLIVISLVGCSPKEPKETAAPISSTIAPAEAKAKPAAPATISPASVQTATIKKPSAATLFQTACSDEITAKMIDPTAAKISYTRLMQGAGYQAQVTLQNQGSGKTMTFDYICLRAEGGEVITKLISD